MKKSSDLKELIGNLELQRDRLEEIEQDPDVIRLNRIGDIQKPDYNLTGKFIAGFGIALIASFFVSLLLSYIAVDFNISFLITIFYYLGTVSFSIDGSFVVQIASVVAFSVSTAINVGLLCIVYGIYRGSKIYIEQIQKALIDDRIYIASLKSYIDSKSDDHRD